MSQKQQLLLSLALLLIASQQTLTFSSGEAFNITEASVQDIQLAFRENRLTSRQLVEAYMAELRRVNATLGAVIEVNPDALTLADKADRERAQAGSRPSMGVLHGIPVLVKDIMATKDRMNTTAGSFALLGSVVAREAGVVTKLIGAGAIVMGKASLSEWSSFRSLRAPSGWSARGGQGKNPYNLSETPCGSSSGSAISVAANIVTVSLGSETDGSILCPASYNSVVGIKPTVGLTSRSGVIPITPRQDTVGPIGKYVADAVYVLDAIVGVDERDGATAQAAQYIPKGGYAQFLKTNGLSGKRIGIVRDPFFTKDPGTVLNRTYEGHFQILRGRGAILIDNLQIANLAQISDVLTSGQLLLMKTEFKMALNEYLKDLTSSPVRSLEDVIAFNTRNSALEKIDEYGQDLFVEAQATNGIGEQERMALEKLKNLSRDGFEKLMSDNVLDAWVIPNSNGSSVLAIGGFPAITVPAGYDETGLPFSLTFGGIKGYEPRLIEIAYDFEQATKARRAPIVSPVGSSNHNAIFSI